MSAEVDVATKQTIPVDSSRDSMARKSGSHWTAISLITLAVIAAAVWYVARGRTTAATSETTATQDSPNGQKSEGVPVDVVKPVKGGMARVSVMNGSVHPIEWANLFAKVSGYLKSQEVIIDGKTVLVDIGVHVKKGDVLAVIDDPEILAEAEQAKADLDHSDAQAQQAAARVDTAKADVKAAEASITQAQAEVGRYVAKRRETEKAYQRYKGLRTLSAVEQDVVDQRQDAYESAVAAEQASHAAVMTADAQAKAAQAKVLSAVADLRAAQAGVEVARAKVKKAKAIADYTEIRSPYTGVITFRSLFPGDFVRSAAESTTVPLLTVARTDIVRIVTKISDKDVPYADVGDPAIVTLDAFPGLKFHGKLARFSESETPTERTMRAEIDLDNGPNSLARGRIREGMYGLATITLQPSSDYLTIPSSCITGEVNGNKAHVYLLRDGKAVLVPLTIGRDDGIHIEITSGLKENDEVIIPTANVSDGVPVVPTPQITTPSTAAAGH
jgi:HlyD family secretion protein